MQAFGRSSDLSDSAIITLTLLHISNVRSKRFSVFIKTVEQGTIGTSYKELVDEWLIIINYLFTVLLLPLGNTLIGFCLVYAEQQMVVGTINNIKCYLQGSCTMVHWWEGARRSTPGSIC